MAEERPTLHIDTDWKKQAQEEKRRLAEEQQKQAEKAAAVAAAPPAPPMLDPTLAQAAPGAGMPSAGGPAGGPTAPAKGGRRGIPEASFSTLVQSLLTQALFYLGEIAAQGVQPVVNLDMAKHQLDLLTILEGKTANNLTDDERHLLDAALYDVRTRFVSVASQFL